LVVNRLLTVAEAAELLATSERFPRRRLIAERRIRFVELGSHVRIPRSALLELIASGTVEPLSVRVSDVDLVEHTITVRRNRIEPLAAPRDAFDGDPKTGAGKRTIAIPPHVVPVIELHLIHFAGPEQLFVSRGRYSVARQHALPGLRADAWQDRLDIPDLP
jgi:excisionase family DNA binding protein